MEALYLLVPLSIGIVFAAIRLFFWMSDSGQFDDMVGPALRILEDRDEAPAAAPGKTEAAVRMGAAAVAVAVAVAVKRPATPD
jgi:cbb3-type cytochrome oxidase maturation protein